MRRRAKVGSALLTGREQAQRFALTRGGLLKELASRIDPQADFSIVFAVVPRRLRRRWVLPSKRGIPAGPVRVFRKPPGTGSPAQPGAEPGSEVRLHAGAPLALPPG